MLRNYFRVAFRNLAKRKVYTLINVIGLSIGICCCLFITLYVFNELGYDTFFPAGDRIFRVTQTSFSPTKREEGATTPFKAGPMLKAEFSDRISSYVRLFNMQEPSITFIYRDTLNNQKKSFREHHFFFADSTFFKVFGIQLLRGKPNEALAAPLSVVLTEKTARKYFGEEDPMGKTLNFKGVRDMTVTGIMKAIPRNSHLSVDILASFGSLDRLYRGDYDRSWFWNPCWTYLRLKKGVDPGQLVNQFPAFVDKYYGPREPKGESVKLNLQSVLDIHLYSHLDQEIEPNNSIFYIYLFSAVGVLILVIACINFMNLSTARSVERSREVGVRKALGADRWQLFKQFIGESYLMCLLAIILAVVLAQLLLPVFNHFVGRQLSFQLFRQWFIPVGLLVLFLIVGLMAGAYPALFISGFQPVNVLNGELSIGKTGRKMRRGMVTFQFTLSVMLIIGTALVYLQLRHMQTKQLGFDHDRVLILPINQNLVAWKFDRFKKEALRNSSIKGVTGSELVLGSREQKYYKYSPASAERGEVSSTLALHVTYDFIKTYDIKILAGRSFSRDHPTDKEKAIIINKRMLAEMDAETPQQALGRVFYYYSPDGKRKPLRVIGVVDNFNYSSVKKEIDPLVIRLVDGVRPIVRYINYAAVKVGPGSFNRSLSYLKNVWKKVNPIDPFEFTFHNRELAKIFTAEKRMEKVAGTFSLLCILVACLGLFGLASFTSSLRTKEIGVRKTLGATVTGIIMMLSREYAKLVLMANVIAWPVIYLVMRAWLREFPYRITLGWNLFAVFAVTLLFSMLVCLLTVSYQSAKVALINPVDSIRLE